MARTRAKFNSATIKRLIAEGRGQGRGEHYQPWLGARDVPSNGYVNRILGWKTKRRHEFMSNLEASYFYLLERSRSVADIREQFPLLPLHETLAISEQCGIKHPRVPGTDEPIVMTTDFLVDVANNGSTVEHARTIKSAKDLSSERVLAKFEIERCYWLRRKVDWAVITERDIPEAFVKNIEWIHPYRDISNKLNVTPDVMQKVEHVLPELLKEGLALTTSTNTCDDRLGLEPGTSLTIVRHLLATNRWLIDMYKLINPRESITLLGQPVAIDR
jgi:hypothetical protein